VALRLFATECTRLLLLLTSIDVAVNGVFFAISHTHTDGPDPFGGVMLEAVNASPAGPAYSASMHHVVFIV